MRTEFAKLLKQLRKTRPNPDLEVVRRAYRVANKAHEGQMRESGDPHISHTLAVAKILVGVELDLTTIAAGLLHDVLEDTKMTAAELQKEFGDDILYLVDGVTKISTMNIASSALSPEVAAAEKQAENLRKMLVATAKDIRVILIKLADRLHNMRTIEYLPEAKRLRIAQETLDIYAPLANRLGIARWRWELEDHAFHQLNPEQYRIMASRVAMKRREREARLKETVEFLEERLTEAEISARVIGRPKHLYSIYQKMVQQGKDFDDVMDILAVRIITQTEAGCYNALGVVHQLWPPVPGRFKDYIAMPKANMYQSVHTTVMRPNGMPLEVQIRTEDMDRTAREGIAAHWRYKQRGQKVDQRFENHVNWLQQMYGWLRDAHAPEELLDSVRRDFQPTEIYVFTPKGEVKELPIGATPLDFAYMVHSEVGHHCLGARVNGRMVPLRYNLQTGDVVGILTSKGQVPHNDWIDIVVTGRARTRIRQRLRELGEIESIEAKPRPAAPPPPRRTTEPRFRVRHVENAPREDLLRIEGAKGVAVQFAKCCNPQPGQPVLGYATRSLGITVHRADCRSFANSRRDPERIIAASWEGDGAFEVGMEVRLDQRPNILADITNAIRPMNVSITKAQFRSGENGDSILNFIFESGDQGTARRIEQTVYNVAGVRGVKTLSVTQVPGD